MSDKFKVIDMQNHVCYFSNDMMNIKNHDLYKVKNENSYKKIFIYHIGYMTAKQTLDT